MGADTIIAHIKAATEDPYVDGIILKIRGFEGGLGSLGIVQEIRNELKKSKKAHCIIPNLKFRFFPNLNYS